MALKLAVQENLIPGENLIQKWEVIRTIGYDGIELRGSAGMHERLPELRAAKAAGAIFSSICVISDRFIGDFDASRRAEALAAMSELCDVAAEIGARGVVTPAAYGMHSNRLPPFTAPRTSDEDREVLLDMLGRLGRHAEQRGVLVLFEPLNRYEDHMVNTLAQAAELAAATGLASVQVGADTYHMNIEEADPLASLRAVAGRLGHVQLSDSNRLEPGAGHLDWGGLYRTLHEIGYDGVLAFECRLSGPAAEVLPRAVATLRAAEGVPA